MTLPPRTRPTAGEAYCWIVEPVWDDPTDDERCVAWGRASAARLAALSASGNYVNEQSEVAGAVTRDAHILDPGGVDPSSARRRAKASSGAQPALGMRTRPVRYGVKRATRALCPTSAEPLTPSATRRPDLSLSHSSGDVERTVIGWLAEAVGCAGFVGSMAGGASSANLLLATRTRRSGGHRRDLRVHV